MIDVDLPACLAFAAIVEADATDFAIHPNAPLGEPADEVDSRNDGAVDRVEAAKDMNREIEDGL